MVTMDMTDQTGICTFWTILVLLQKQKIRADPHLNLKDTL